MSEEEYKTDNLKIGKHSHIVNEFKRYLETLHLINNPRLNLLTVVRIRRGIIDVSQLVRDLVASSILFLKEASSTARAYWSIVRLTDM